MIKPLDPKGAFQFGEGWGIKRQEVEGDGSEKCNMAQCLALNYKLNSQLYSLSCDFSSKV